MLSKQQQQEIFEKTRERVHAVVPEERRHAACFYWTYFGMQELRALKKRVILRAGSCNWRFRTNAAAGDDGPTHYAYQWGITPFSIASVLQGNLPEMHIWFAVMDAMPQLVDLATGTLITAAAQKGFVWDEAYRPPEFLWETSVSPTWPQAQYEPTEVACGWVQRLIDRLAGMYPTPEVMKTVIGLSTEDYLSWARRLGYRITKLQDSYMVESPNEQEV
jgi:hypothetical protein